MAKVAIHTTCPICGKHTYISVPKEDYERYRKGDELIQEVFDYLSAGEREMLISGICPDCWKHVFVVAR